MAEIRIERKRKPVWPWLLALLLLALIVWALYQFTNKPEQADEEQVPETSLVMPSPSPGIC
ncbi:MAG: hypothetical protein ACO1O1_06090 [Adhaeribacter sp.]